MPVSWRSDVEVSICEDCTLLVMLNQIVNQIVIP